MRTPLLTIALLACASCAGPGFRAEAVHTDRKPAALDLRTAPPEGVQELRETRLRRTALRFAVGGPNYSALGYGQFIHEDQDLPTAAGGGELEGRGFGAGVIGRQRFEGFQLGPLEFELPYRLGLNYVEGSGRGQATAAGTFGDFIYYEWEADVGASLRLGSFDLTGGWAWHDVKGKVRVHQGTSGPFKGLRGTNHGPFATLGYDFGSIPLRCQVHLGFGDLEELRISAGLYF